METMVETPKIEINERQHRLKDDPDKYQADAWLPSGRDYHAIAPTPAEALHRLALHWLKRDKSSTAALLEKE